jgi:hypothetical protein
MRIAFADEAVEGHFALCAAVQEYVLLASINGGPPRRHRFVGIVLAVLMFALLSTACWFWRDQYQAHLLPLEANQPPQTVHWRRDEVFYQHPAGQAFVFLLPRLERMPSSVPATITLEPSSHQPPWMEFDPKALLLSGVSPMIGNDQAYHLVFEARVEDGPASRLDVYVNIIGEATPPLPPPSEASSPVPSDRLPAKDCLLKILKGEPC